MKLAKAYCGEPEKELISNPLNLSSTLEKLYAWEKKLYKEVKVWIWCFEIIQEIILRDEELQPQLAALINGYQIA